MEFMTPLQAFDEQKPSLFELLSEQQLNGLLPPTLRYLLTIATQRYPRYLLRVLNSFDELHALLMLLVERHYLRTRGIVTPTACQTGFVYCYACIHRWLEGAHPKQEAFMEDRQARWESGAGRCAVTGRRVLGGTEGLRRIIV
ncbi:Putative beta-glucosidase L [Verticillium dahliae VDG1]|nr:Putative beta-glucosidase L [Verticillium dahliae VDG1]